MFVAHFGEPCKISCSSNLKNKQSVLNSWCMQVCNIQVLKCCVFSYVSRVDKYTRFTCRSSDVQLSSVPISSLSYGSQRWQSKQTAVIAVLSCCRNVALSLSIQNASEFAPTSSILIGLPTLGGPPLKLKYRYNHL